MGPINSKITIDYLNGIYWIRQPNILVLNEWNINPGIRIFEKKMGNTMNYDL